MRELGLYQSHGNLLRKSTSPSQALSVIGFCFDGLAMEVLSPMEMTQMTFDDAAFVLLKTKNDLKRFVQSAALQSSGVKSRENDNRRVESFLAEFWSGAPDAGQERNITRRNI